MENPFVATTKLHPVSIRNRLLALGVTSNGHHHSLAFCRQQFYHHHQPNSVDFVCGSFSQRRINTSGRQRTANSCKNLASRNVRVRLGSRSDNEADASLAIETRKNAVWGVFHNFRCEVCPNFTFLSIHRVVRLSGHMEVNHMCLFALYHCMYRSLDFCRFKTHSL